MIQKEVNKMLRLLETTVREMTKTTNSQENNEQKQQCWRYHNIQLQTIAQSHNNKNSMVLAQNRYEDQRNRIENPDMNPHSYTHLIFTKTPKTYNGEKTVSLTNVAGKTGYLHAEN
jgi:hypothetical protein